MNPKPGAQGGGLRGSGWGRWGGVGVGPHWGLQEQKQPPWEDQWAQACWAWSWAHPCPQYPTAPHYSNPVGEDSEAPAVSIPWSVEGPGLPALGEQDNCQG